MCYINSVYVFVSVLYQQYVCIGLCVISTVYVFVSVLYQLFLCGCLCVISTVCSSYVRVFLLVCM